MNWLKKIILIFLVISFLLSGRIVLALEIKWPTLPGAETPNQIEQKIERGIITKEETFPLYLNYFLRLFYLIAITIAIGVIIFGGVLYLISGARPTLLVEAKKCISRALLALFILLTSYLVLGVLNPQLLVFKIKPVTPSPVPSLAVPEEKKIVGYQIPGNLPEKIIQELDEKINFERREVHKIEVPFLEILNSLDEAIVLTERLKESLKNCQCGTSKWYLKWEGLKGQCKGGMSREEKEDPSFWRQLGAGSKEEFEKFLKGGQNLCLTRCQDCGTQKDSRGKLLCDLREVDKRQESDGSFKWWVKDPGGSWREMNDEDKETSLKYLRTKLQEVLAKLQAQKTKLSSEQMGLVEKTLNLNTWNYLFSQAAGITFQEDFLEEKKFFQEQGFETELKRMERFPEPELVALSPASRDPLNAVYYTEGLPIPQETKAHNKKVTREAKRINSPFSVFTQLSLEEIEKMIGECLRAAFGESDFFLSLVDLTALIEETLQKGLGDFFSEKLEVSSQEIVQEFVKNLRNQVREKMEEKQDKDKCKEECEESGEQNCEKKCDPKNSLPPNWLSNKLVAYLTADLKEHLPKEIKNLLAKKVKDILSAKINDILGSEVRGLIDKVFKGALSKSLTEQIPWLKQQLEKRMVDVLPDLVANPLERVDVFLTSHLKNLKKKIDQEIEELIKELARELSKPALELIDSYKRKHPNLFREHLTKEQCSEYETEGYYWNWNGEKCERVTPEMINDNWGDLKASFQLLFLRTWSQKKYCQRAGYCWVKTKAGEECQECQWIDLKGLTPTRENFKRLGKAFLAGLVNFAEQFLVALTQTAIYTLTKYTKVWVEDEILVPLQPYLQQLTEFQKKLHHFLYSTIEKLLPWQIAGYLQSSIFGILDDLCSRKKTTIEIYKSVTVSFSESDLALACDLNKELQKKVISYLSQDIQDFLNTKIWEFLPPDLQEILDKSWAEILWPGITNIRALILGTPKEILCGELITENFEVKTTEGQKTLFQKCQELKAPTLVPYFRTSPDDERYRFTCPFIWYGCQNPLVSWGTIGGMLKTILENECQKINRKVENICDGEDCQTCDIPSLELPQKPGEEFGPAERKKKLQYQCALCNVLKSSLALSLFTFLVKEYNPEKEEEKEIAIYQTLTVMFPSLIEEVDKLAEKRGFQTKWQGEPRRTAERAGSFEELPTTTRNLAWEITAWFTKNTRLKDALTAPPLGVIKPTEKGKETLFREPGKGAQENFLSLSFYSLLKDEACLKIKNDFAKFYPNWTIENIKTKKAQQTAGALPYSLQGLETPTLAMALRGLLETEEVPFEEKIPYLACKILDYRPAEIFGLEQPLVRYLRPKEYQILFDLIYKELKAEERPQPLNLLLNYLYNKTPLNLLFEIGTTTQELASFLNRKVDSWLNQGVIAESLVSLICEKLEKDCNSTLGRKEWKDLQEFLRKTPLQLIEEHLDQNLLPKKITSSRSIMDLISEKTFLGERYVDTLGRLIGLDKLLFKVFETTGEFENKINTAIASTTDFIQRSFDKILIETPQKIIQTIVKNLAGLLGIKLAQQASHQMVGSCRKASSQEKRNKQCPPGEVYKEATQECCSLSEDLVCQPRCRAKPSDEECNSEKGESEMIVNGETKCCLPVTEDGDKGLICRPPKKRDPIECKREGERKISIATKELCCREVTLKEIGGEEMFCTNLLQCVIDKFTFHLEMLSDILLYGVPLEELVPQEEITPPPSPPAFSCPTNLKELCPNPELLAHCSGTPYPPQRAPALQELLNCLEEKIEEKTGYPLPEEGGSNDFYGSIFTYDHTYPLCNYTRKRGICSTKCSHSDYSCHYGGEKGTEGALAVDIGNETNFTEIKEALQACERELDLRKKYGKGIYILLEKDHIHISHPLCDRR